MPEAEIPTAPDHRRHVGRLRFPRFRWFLFAMLGVVLLLWVVPTLIDTISSGDGLEGFERPYLLIGTFVAFDAVLPIFPSESLLTTASTLAGQDGSDIVLWAVVLGGTLGAIIGDSLLYWLSRTIGRNVLAPRLEQARRNAKVGAAMEVLGSTAPLLIVVGRFVPGVRFAVNVTMGIGRYPYRRFLLFSSIGGATWAAYTCVFSFWIGQALDGYPVLSIATSVLITTAMLGLMYIPLKRRYEAQQVDQDGSVEPSEASAAPAPAGPAG